MEIFTQSYRVKLAPDVLNKIQQIFREKEDLYPFRFCVIGKDGNDLLIEVDVARKMEKFVPSTNIFQVHKRDYENTDAFNVALIIPTGIGENIGGHSGDACVLARLIASACDNLFTHPNVVNAADINEMPDNTLYLEGSSLTRFLMGELYVSPVRKNKVCFLVEPSKEKIIDDIFVNMVSAAHVTLGIDCDIKFLDFPPIARVGYSESSRAGGSIEKMEGFMNLIDSLRSDYDCFAISSLLMDEDEEAVLNYFKSHKQIEVNPWGGLEAMLTHTLSLSFNLPFAHAPLMLLEHLGLNTGITDPRKAPEAVAKTYAYCILKGLMKAPRISSEKGKYSASDISCLIQPAKCIGLPIFAALEQGIPIIAVNVSWLNEMGRIIFVENYFEAVGVMHAIKNGLNISSLKRPIPKTKILSDK